MKTFEEVQKELSRGRTMRKHEYQLLREHVDTCGVYVDIGCWMGYSTRAIVQALREKALQGIVLAIDPLDLETCGRHREDVKALGFMSTRPFLFANLEAWGITERVIVVAKRSQDVKVSSLVEFVVIDGSHKYEDVKQDFEVWYPRVRKGRYLVFHDYQRIPGPTKVVDQLVRPKCTEIARLGQLIIFRKEVSDDQVPDVRKAPIDSRA